LIEVFCSEEYVIWILKYVCGDSPRQNEISKLLSGGVEGCRSVGVDEVEEGRK
jgi:hypothetical protein